MFSSPGSEKLVRDKTCEKVGQAISHKPERWRRSLCGFFGVGGNIPPAHNRSGLAVVPYLDLDCEQKKASLKKMAFLHLLYTMYTPSTCPTLLFHWYNYVCKHGIAISLQCFHHVHCSHPRPCERDRASSNLSQVLETPCTQCARHAFMATHFQIQLEGLYIVY